MYIKNLHQPCYLSSFSLSPHVHSFFLGILILWFFPPINFPLADLILSYQHPLIALSDYVPFFQVTWTSFTVLSPFLFTYFLTDSFRDHNHICFMWLCQLQLNWHSNWRFGSSCAITKTRHGHCCITCTGCRYSCLLHDCVYCRWDVWLACSLHHSTDPFWNYNNLCPLWVCQYVVNGGYAWWLGTDGPQPHPWHVQDRFQGPYSWDSSVLLDRLCGRWGVSIVANIHSAIIEGIFACSLPKSCGQWTCRP